MGRFPPWADLPQELLSTIASFLNSNPLDLHCFRAVCKSWRSSFGLPSTLLLSPSLPLILPPVPPLFTHFNIPGDMRDPCLLSVTVVYALKSVDSDSRSSWLLFLDQWYPPYVSVRHPLSTDPFSLPLDFPRKLNLLDFRASEIGRFCNLSRGRHVGGNLVKPTIWSPGWLQVVFLLNESAVFALSDDGKLGLLRLGVEKNGVGSEWEIIQNARRFRFDDIVDYRGRFLGIDRRGRVYEMGHHFSGMNEIVLPIRGGGGRRKRLIDSCGMLHLVVRCDVKKKAEEMGGTIKVYKMNENRRKWIEVTNIGDQIFFFGANFSFSASAQHFEGFCGKNCIMFEENSFQKYDGRDGDSWLFHGSRSSSLRVGVYQLEHGAHLQAIESYPCHSSMFWPPPTWISLDNKSKLLGTLESAISRVGMQITSLSRLHLEAKYEELSSVVKLVVSGDSINLLNVSRMLEGRGILKSFILLLYCEIDYEIKSVKKSITEDVAVRQRHRDSTALPDQVRTSNHGVKGRHGCINCLQKPTTDPNDDEGWLCREINRRLYTHFELAETLKGIVNVLETF